MVPKLDATSPPLPKFGSNLITTRLQEHSLKNIAQRHTIINQPHFIGIFSLTKVSITSLLAYLFPLYFQRPASSARAEAEFFRDWVIFEGIKRCCYLLGEPPHEYDIFICFL
jgi:hypothetical protein